MRSGTVENLHDFKGKLDKIKELKFFLKIYAVTLDKCGNEKVHKKDLKKVEVWFTMELSGEKW